MVQKINLVSKENREKKTASALNTAVMLMTNINSSQFMTASLTNVIFRKNRTFVM